jgi:uncharacterized membrane protein
MKIIDIIWNSKEKILLYSLILVVAIVIAGVVLFPCIFYDNWIWKYYWGPVVADSLNSGHGTAVFNGVDASEGYTMVSELTYGVILIIALYYIYRLLKKLKIRVDWRFALALMPFILFGPVTRVLEDTGYFHEPWVYWFISPFIYFLIAFFAILFLVLGCYIENKFGSSKITVNKVLFVGGLCFLIPSIVPIGGWILGARWGSTTGISFNVFLIVLGIILLVVFLVYFIANYFKENKKIVVYKNPLNLAMLSGHLIDGLTSYISIKDPFSMGLFYTEKHPASNFLLEIWGPLFPIVKFLLIIFVVYVFDVLYKDELKGYANLINLLKIGILILGFSPGLRDLLRVTMGV